MLFKKIQESFPLLNFIIAIIYAVVYDYVYCNYMYGIWAGYVDGVYNPMNRLNFVVYVVLCAFPFVFYRGLKHIASAFSLFVYVLVYIPFIESLFVNGYPNDIKYSYSLLLFVLVCLFFQTDRLYLLKKLFEKERKLISFKVIIILVILLLPIELVLNIGQLHFVNFFEEGNDLYSSRADTQLKGIYVVCLIRSALLPLLLVYCLNRKLYLGLSAVFLAYLSVFMLDKQKLTIIFPFALMVVYYAFRYYKEKFSRSFHVFFMGLFAVAGMFFTIVEASPVTLALGMIIVLRVQCIAGAELERYFDFFILSDNPPTYYTHIGIINNLIGMYPYGDMSIGQIVADDGGNSNAAFWLMDGVAAAGLLGCVIISVFFIIFKSIMNSLDTRCSVGICVTVLLFGLQSMVNMSLFTTILSNGFLALFFLFLFTDVGAIERRE